jgi:hypothetical protein
MTGNDRYRIYGLLGRVVEIQLPDRFGGDRIDGIVDRVYRDIFERQIQITLDGVRHTFQEPDAIVSEGETMVFVYGDVDSDTEDDDAVFRDLMAGSYDGDVNAHLRETARIPISRIVIRVGDVKKKPSERWRSRVAVA